MEVITFTCTTITPLFMAGADGSTPELRAPGIKWALRFWWRALNGHLAIDSQIRDKKIISAGLRDQEATIFGGAGANQSDGQRSSFTLQVKPIRVNESAAEKLVPHKEKGFTAKAFVNTSFEVIVRLLEDYSIEATVQEQRQKIFDRERLLALVQLTFLLGGLGRRSRRGMGSVKLESINSSITGNIPVAPTSLEGIYDLVKKLSSHYTLQAGSRIQNAYSGRMEKYPWIVQIELGKPQRSASDLTRKISDATHDVKGIDARKYEPSLGHSHNGRFASPIYVSVLPGYSPVVTTLYAAPDRDIYLIDAGLQDSFRRKILN